jgi:hypothetical protein
MLAAYNVAKSISALVPTPLKNNDSSVTSNHSVDNKQLMLAAYNVAKSISALVPTPLKDNGNSATSNLSADNKQEAASAIITNALNVVNHLMSSISLQLQNLQQASDDVNQSITLRNNLAANYLDADYEQGAEKFRTAILTARANIYFLVLDYKMAALAYQLAED